MPKIRSIGELEDFEKPREKLKERGPSALDERELIAILLSSGSKERSVLELASRIKKLLQTDFERISLQDLTQIEGVGLAKASRILAGLELSRRYFKPSGLAIRSPEDVLRVPQVGIIRDKRQEYFVCISLNGAHEVIKARVVTKGLVNETQIHPREVFAPVLEDRATAVVFVHNHPSGSLEPGQKDIKLDRKLREAGKLLGIKVLDHVVVTKDGFSSVD